METCTYCPIVRYWYLVLAIVFLLWAIYRLQRGKNTEDETKTPPHIVETGAFDTLISSGLVLIEFWAPWCGSCKVQADIIEKIKDDLPEGVRIHSINIEDVEELGKKYRIRSVPTWLVFKNGREIDRFSGVQSRNKLLEIISRKQ